MRIGLVPMSAKPFHAGHFGLIEIASKENDQIHVFVSTADRSRKNEIPIRGQDMVSIWNKYLLPIMPGNAVIEMISNPVRSVYTFLETENLKTSDNNIFTIYSDLADLSRFPKASMEKYFGNLVSEDLVKLRGVKRSETVNISGTEMRRLLSLGPEGKDSFIQNLPDLLSDDAKASIWNILHKEAPNTQSESLLRYFIREQL